MFSINLECAPLSLSAPPLSMTNSDSIQVKHVTLAEVMATCPVTARKVRNAITVCQVHP